MRSYEKICYRANAKNNKYESTQDRRDESICRCPSMPLLNTSIVLEPVLYSKKVEELIGDYDPETELAEDYDYSIRVSRKFSMRHLDEPLYFYRIHNESLYSSRHHEVEVVKLLVRLKHNIMEIDQITDLFINFIASEKRGFLKLNKILTKILFLKKD